MRVRGVLLLFVALAAAHFVLWALTFGYVFGRAVGGTGSGTTFEIVRAVLIALSFPFREPAGIIFLIINSLLWAAVSTVMVLGVRQWRRARVVAA